MTFLMYLHAVRIPNIKLKLRSFDETSFYIDRAILFYIDRATLLYINRAILFYIDALYFVYNDMQYKDATLGV